MPLGAIGIGLGTALAGTAAAGATIYGASKSASAQDRAAQTQAKASADAIALQREQEAQQKAEFDAQQAAAAKAQAATEANNAALLKQSQDQWAANFGLTQSQYDFQRAQYEAEQARRAPYRAAGAQALSSLGDILGMHFNTSGTYGQGAPTPSASSSGPADSAQTGDAAALKALLDSGADPQTAIGQFNQKYGRTTGNEAVYYDPSKHGGVATIGLPSAYLANVGGQWTITQRTPESGMPARGGMSRAFQPSVMPTGSGSAPVANPLAANYAQVIPMRALLRTSAARG